MIFQFPLAHNDELLVSILARFATRQGLRDDKVALELLFGSRNIVPAALLQGHLQVLLSHVSHIWPVSAEEIIQNHSILPFFQSFMEPLRIKALKDSLIIGEKSHVMAQVGVNASNIQWPRYYRYCPECLAEDQELLAYSYWRRSFQLPGVLVCPIHHCFLQNSFYKLNPSRRHRLWDAALLVNLKKVVPLYIEPGDKLCKLASSIKQLLAAETPYVTPLQWTAFYQKWVKELGFVNGKRLDHEKIRMVVEHYWGKLFLEQHGLSLSSDNNWLLAFFRKHRRHYSPLHHLVCLMALLPFYSVLGAIGAAALTAECSQKKKIYFNAKAKERVGVYRSLWLKICSHFSMLKEIRATKEGQRVYSWLYRFDNAWLLKHLPRCVRKDNGRQVDWRQRDSELVRELIFIRDRSYENLSLPRMTQAWFIARTNVSWGIGSHLDKLPLCKSFFVKYTESVGEYQVRRVLDIIDRCIHKGEPIPKPHEIKRIAGLSKERCREPVKQILRMDFEAISRTQLLSRKYRINKS